MDILAAEIADFIDENPAEPSLPVSMLESNIKRIEEYRLTYRIKSKESNKEKLSKADEAIMADIKTYIKQVREIIVNFQIRDDAKSLITQERPIYFEISNISTLLDFIDETHRVEIYGSCDDDLTKYKNDADTTTKSLEKISTRISHLLLISTAKSLPDIETLKIRYEKLILYHQSFVKQLNKEFADREISKQKTFNKSHLSIKLSKFKGFSS